MKWTKIIIKTNELRLLLNLVRPMISKTKMRTHSLWIRAERKSYILAVPLISEEHQLILKDLGFHILSSKDIGRKYRRNHYHQIRKI